MQTSLHFVVANRFFGLNFTILTVNDKGPRRFIMDLDLFDHFGSTSTGGDASSGSSGAVKRSANHSTASSSKKGRLDELDGIEDRVSGKIVETVRRYVILWQRVLF